MKKVLLGMSGGVDSSVSALLLKKAGYEVIGVTLILTPDNDPSEDAKKICDQLGIEFHKIDLTKEFKEYVIDNFVNSYKNGVTPNPCVLCNKYLKFGKLVEFADKLGCELISTGHYASVKDDCLVKSDANSKDQTYFLYNINKNVINRLIFPLEHFKSKDEIRKIAADNNLFVATKKDSQEICFIPNDNHTQFLENSIEKTPNVGNFVDKQGNILGKHKGIIYYTIGQRKGLGISAKTPLYVVSINVDKNEVVLGQLEDLYSKSLEAYDVNLLVNKLPSKVLAKIRYRSIASEAIVTMTSATTCRVEFIEPVKSITKGQSVVFYDNNVCLGGGIIK